MPINFYNNISFTSSFNTITSRIRPLSIQSIPSFLFSVKSIIVLHPKTLTRWNYFIRSRITNYFRPIIQQYYCVNKLGKTFKVTAWYCKITTILFQIHFTSWNEYYFSIYNLPSKDKMPPAKESLPKLVQK